MAKVVGPLPDNRVWHVGRRRLAWPPHRSSLLRRTGSYFSGLLGGDKNPLAGILAVGVLPVFVLSAVPYLVELAIIVALTPVAELGRRIGVLRWQVVASSKGAGERWCSVRGRCDATLLVERVTAEIVNRGAPSSLPCPPKIDSSTRISADLTSVAIAAHGSLLAAASDNGTLRIWDTATGKLRRTVAGDDEYIMNAMAIAGDGSWLACVGDDETVRIWDACTGQVRHVLTGHTDEANAVAIAPDGSWLVSAGDDQTVRIWDACTGQIRHVLTGHTRGVVAVAIAPDGSWLASAGVDQTVRIWDAFTGAPRHALTGPGGLVHAVAIAPDGRWLAGACADGTVCIWDVFTGRIRHTLTGHTDAVLSVAIAPDGSWLASASPDQTVRIWDASTGHNSDTLPSRTYEASSVAIAPDGSWLAANADGAVGLWNVSGGTAAPIGFRSP